MAQELKMTHYPDQHADVIWVNETSGAYVADYNDTGWGDPNSELSESCLMIYAERVIDDADNHVVEVLTSQFIYDDTALNTESKEFQLTYDEDGHYNISLLRFPVSVDGENFVEGGAIGEGDYVYYNNQLYLHDGLELVAVTDFASLIGNENITQKTCEVLFQSKAIIKLNNARLEFRNKRLSHTEDIDPYREKWFDMKSMIEDAYKQFVVNMKSSARETVNQFHELFS